LYYVRRLRDGPPFVADHDDCRPRDGPSTHVYHPPMPPSVHVHLLPGLGDPAALSSGVAAVIDVLRASTTIVHALAHGAKAVVPFESVEQARAAARHFPDGTALLGGERGGERIDGFDLGNSPLEYTPQRVSGRTILFTTTNGTRALRQCRSSERVLIAAFVNQRALVETVQREDRPVNLVCAGTDGQLTAEDILFAGAVASALALPSTDVQTQMAVDYYRARSLDETAFREAIRSSRGGQNLQRLGMDADIERASQRDMFDIVPEWHAATNQIVVGGG
jgi:2-phosphosulfolactate phosphatase